MINQIAKEKYRRKFNADEHRIWTWRWLSYRSWMISLKTSKSKQNIGLRHATFDIMNLSRVQKWRGGKNYDKNPKHRGGLWLNEASGVVLVGCWQDNWGKANIKYCFRFIIQKRRWTTYNQENRRDSISVPWIDNPQFACLSLDLVLSVSRV